jgi:hypothetical protein
MEEDEIQRQNKIQEQKVETFEKYRIEESRRKHQEEERQRQRQTYKKKRTCIFRGTVRGIQRKYGQINEQRNYVRDRMTRCKNNQWRTRHDADVETEVSRIVNEANRNLVKSKSDGSSGHVDNVTRVEFYPAENLASNEYYFLVPKDNTLGFNVETQNLDPPPKVMKIKKLGALSTVKVDGITSTVEILPEGSFFTYDGGNLLLCQSGSISFNKLTNNEGTFETGQRYFYNVGSSSVNVSIDHFERKFLASSKTETQCFVRVDGNKKVIQTTLNKLTPLHTTRTETRTQTPTGVTKTKSILKTTKTPTPTSKTRRNSDAYNTYLEIAHYANQPYKYKFEKQTAIQNVRENPHLSEDQKKEIITRIQSDVPISDLDKEAALNAANNESPHRKPWVDAIRRTYKRLTQSFRKRKHVAMSERNDDNIKPGKYYG